MRVQNVKKIAAKTFDTFSKKVQLEFLNSFCTVAKIFVKVEKLLKKSIKSYNSAENVAQKN